jgi:predicted nucleic acid-binding protein
MNIDKSEILNNICYTELVYSRINKKLKTHFSRTEIEELLYKIIKETKEFNFERVGKNIYVTNHENQIRITINSNTFRIITVDKVNRSYERNNKIR